MTRRNKAGTTKLPGLTWCASPARRPSFACNRLDWTPSRTSPDRDRSSGRREPRIPGGEEDGKLRIEDRALRVYVPQSFIFNPLPSVPNSARLDCAARLSSRSLRSPGSALVLSLLYPSSSIVDPPRQPPLPLKLPSHRHKPAKSTTYAVTFAVTNGSHARHKLPPAPRRECQTVAGASQGRSFAFFVFRIPHSAFRA